MDIFKRLFGGKGTRSTPGSEASSATYQGPATAKATSGPPPDAPASISLEEAVSAYFDGVRTLNEEGAENLRPGAAEQDIATLEHGLGFEVSAELKTLLRIHDGTQHEWRLLPGWELFSAARIVHEWKVWAELYHQQFKPDNLACSASGPIKSDEWWRLKWVPFCGDGGGNHLCIDLDPAPGGRVGQVIEMWHDDPQRVVIASSLQDYFSQIATEMAAGRLYWSEDYGCISDEPDY